MKSCKSCLQTLPEKEVSYREAAVREEPLVLKKTPLKEKFSKVIVVSTKAGTFFARLIVGSLAIAGVIALILLATVGLYTLGMFVGNDLLHWGIRNPGGWFLGLGIFIIPLISYLIGKEILNERQVAAKLQTKTFGSGPR